MGYMDGSRTNRCGTRLMSNDGTTAWLKRHPSFPVIVWAVGCHFFALNLKKNVYECWRRVESESAIRSIEFFSRGQHDISNNREGFWLLGTNDKSLVVLDHVSYRVTERFLLRKKPVGALVCGDGTTVILGDKFGDLSKVTFQHLQSLTCSVIYETMFHVTKGKRHMDGLQEIPHIMKWFKNHHVVKEFLQVPPPTDQHERVKDAANPVPFAGHMAAITVMQLTPDQSKIITGDRDDKIRVGSVQTEHETLGYCLGHTELVTCLCCVDNSFVISGSGDKTLRLFDIRETGEQKQCMSLESIPLQLYLTPDSSFLLVIMENSSGVTVVKLDKNFNEWTMCWFSFIQLPDRPLALLVVPQLEKELEFPCFHHLTRSNPQINVDPCFYWINSVGQLQLPVSLVLNTPVFLRDETSTWLGEQIGESLTPEPSIFWKHNHQAV